MTRWACIRGTVKEMAHPHAEADEAPAGRRNNLKTGVGLDEAHKQLAQVDVVPGTDAGKQSTPQKDILLSCALVPI